MTADLDKLIRASRHATLSPSHTVPALGALIDEAGDAGRLDGIQAALDWATRLLESELSDHDRALVNYFSANAHAIARCLRRPERAASEWEDVDLAGEVMHLRLAIQAAGWGELSSVRRCQVLTNLGNVFCRCGRLVEALEWYDQALTIDPAFGMAIANRGLTLKAYANLVHEENRRTLMVRAAHRELSRAARLPLEGNARTVIRQALAALKGRAPAASNWEATPTPGTLDRIPEQARAYREWCLQQRLILDELNDLVRWPIAARDTLSLPAYVTPLDEGLGLVGFLNQMKQEFVTARWMVFQGQSETWESRESSHSADAAVVLADTMDCPAYSYRTEQLRLAFRSAYSLLDKLAFFLNRYLSLGIRDEQVTFRSLWFVRRDSTTQMRPEVAQSISDPLRALIWIAQDLFEPDSPYGAALLPDAQDLWRIRRHLEHRYLKLHWVGQTQDWRGGATDGLRDQLALSLTRRDFEDKTLRLMKMVRASLVYLTWAMAVEEARRDERRGTEVVAPDVLIPPLRA